MTIIETIECTPNEETAFRIADECCTRMETLYDMEGREFTREHYIVYFTYFVCQNLLSFDATCTFSCIFLNFGMCTMFSWFCDSLSGSISCVKKITVSL